MATAESSMVILRGILIVQNWSQRSCQSKMFGTSGYHHRECVGNSWERHLARVAAYFRSLGRAIVPWDFDVTILESKQLWTGYFFLIERRLLSRQAEANRDE